MLCHERFTQYKTAATEAEREQARQRYLESIGSVPSPRRAPRSPLGERKGAFDAKCQKPPSVDTTEGRQSAYSPSSPLIRRRSCTSFGLPNEWQVCSDRPLCRRLGNGQAATLLQSSILLKTCHYRDKISTCYCCAVPVPFQRLYKAFLRY